MIFSSLIRVYTFYHSQQSDQDLHYFPFAAVWSVSTLFALLSLIGSTLLVILSCLVRVYTICHTFFATLRFKYTTKFSLPKIACPAIVYAEIVIVIDPFFVGDCHWIKVYRYNPTEICQQRLQGVRNVAQKLCSWERSFRKVYSVYYSQQSDQGLCYLSFSAVWSRSTLFAILSSLIRVYTICHSEQSDQGQGLLSPSETVWSRSTQLGILSHLIMVYTIPYSF